MEPFLSKLHAKTSDFATSQQGPFFHTNRREIKRRFQKCIPALKIFLDIHFL